MRSNSSTKRPDFVKQSRLIFSSAQDESLRAQVLIYIVVASELSGDGVENITSLLVDFLFKMDLKFYSRRITVNVLRI